MRGVDFGQGECCVPDFGLASKFLGDCLESRAEELMFLLESLSKLAID